MVLLLIALLHQFLQLQTPLSTCIFSVHKIPGGDAVSVSKGNMQVFYSYSYKDVSEIKAPPELGRCQAECMTLSWELSAHVSLLI